MPLGANTNTNEHKGTQPKQEIKKKKKDLTKNKFFPNPFQNNPTLEILESKT